MSLQYILEKRSIDRWTKSNLQDVPTFFLIIFVGFCSLFHILINIGPHSNIPFVERVYDFSDSFPELIYMNIISINYLHCENKAGITNTHTLGAA